MSCSSCFCLLAGGWLALAPPLCSKLQQLLCGFPLKSPQGYNCLCLGYELTSAVCAAGRTHHAQLINWKPFKVSSNIFSKWHKKLKLRVCKWQLDLINNQRQIPCIQKLHSVFFSSMFSFLPQISTLLNTALRINVWSILVLHVQKTER